MADIAQTFTQPQVRYHLIADGLSQDAIERVRAQSGRPTA